MASREDIKWTIVIAVATWIGVFAAIWSVNEQRQDAASESRDVHEALNAVIGDELDNTFDATEMRRARRTLAKELLAKQPISDWRVIDFMDKVGMYQRLGRIDRETAYSSFSYYIERYWELCHDQIKAFRNQEDDDSYYTDFEDIDNSMLLSDAAERKVAKSKVKPTPNELHDFLVDESNLPD